MLIIGWHKVSGCQIFGFAVKTASQALLRGTMGDSSVPGRAGLSWKRLMALGIVVRSKAMKGTHKTPFFPACKGW